MVGLPVSDALGVLQKAGRGGKNVISLLDSLFQRQDVGGGDLSFCRVLVFDSLHDSIGSMVDAGLHKLMDVLFEHDYELFNTLVSLRWVLVKTSTSFLPQPTSVHILDKKRAGAELGVPKFTLKNLHNRKTGIQADKIGESERSHWHICTHFHGLIDIFNRRDSFQ